MTVPFLTRGRVNPLKHASPEEIRAAIKAIANEADAWKKSQLEALDLRVKAGKAGLGTNLHLDQLQDLDASGGLRPTRNPGDYRQFREREVRRIDEQYRDMKRAEMLTGKSVPETVDPNLLDFPNQEWDRIARILHDQDIIKSESYWQAVKAQQDPHFSPLKPKGKPGLGLEVADDAPDQMQAVMRDKDGAPIGALNFGVKQTPDGKLVIDPEQELAVYVTPGHRRKGVATKLYEFAKKQGFDVDAVSGKGLLSPDGEQFVEGRRLNEQAMAENPYHDVTLDEEILYNSRGEKVGRRTEVHPSFPGRTKMPRQKKPKK